MNDSGINCNYVPVGYNDSYHISEGVKRDIDISFVGTPYKNRLKLLEKVAEAALQNQWNFKVYGPFFEQPYFWKPFVFKFAYPALSHFVQNVTFTPTQINEIYNKSKIVINIHNNENKGVNPRSFEIIASGAMQLLDAREDYDIIRPGKDAAIYHDSDELIGQIAYYLSHDAEREKIARLGHESVQMKRSMVDSLRTMLLGE